MRPRRLSEILGVPRSTNWTYRARQTGELARVVKLSPTAVLVATRRGECVLPRSLFSTIFALLPPGGCVAEWREGRWTCTNCAGSWTPGVELPACERHWRNPPEVRRRQP